MAPVLQSSPGRAANEWQRGSATGEDGGHRTGAGLASLVAWLNRQPAEVVCARLLAAAPVENGRLRLGEAGEHDHRTDLGGGLGGAASHAPAAM